MEKIEKYTEQITALAVDFMPKVLIAIAVLIIGWYIIGRLSKFARKRLEKSKISKDLQPFLVSFVSIGLKIVLITVAAGIVGIQTASFAALIAAVGFAIGLAMQGNLSNFAAGVLILLLRPFKVGDELVVKGKWCFVKEIQIFYTIMRNFDKTVIVIPNSLMMKEMFQNNTVPDIRGVKLRFNIPYTEDIYRIRDILTEAAFKVEGIKTDMEPFLWIGDFKEYYINATITFYTTRELFWFVEPKMKKAFHDAMKAHNVKIIYPISAEFGEIGSEKSWKTLEEARV